MLNGQKTKVKMRAPVIASAVLSEYFMIKSIGERLEQSMKRF